MTDILLPQTLALDQFVTGIDEDGNLTSSQVDFSQLSFTGVFGAKVYSSTENTIGTGIKTWILDDAMDFAVDDPIQIKSQDDLACYMYGIITALDTTIAPVSITVLCTKASAGVMTGTNWEIQKVPNFAAVSSSILGYSSDSLQFGSSHDIFVGSVVSITTDANKLFNTNSHILVASVTDSTQFFRGIAQSYNSSTGALSIFVTDVGSTASGTYAAWSVTAQDGPVSQSSAFFTSASDRTIGSGNFTFEILAGLSIPVGGSVNICSATAPSNAMYGKVTAYSGTTLSITVPATGVFGSGEYTLWYCYVIDAPPIYGSPQTSSITQVASTSTDSTTTITIPGTVLAGDLIVLSDSMTHLSSFPTSVVPTGFTAVADVTQSGAVDSFSGLTLYARSILSYKLATAADISAVVTGISATGSGGVKILSVFRSDIPATLLTLASAVSSSAVGAPSNKTITASSGGVPLAVVASFFGDTDHNAFTHAMNPAADSEVSKATSASNGSIGYLDWKLYNSAPADNTISQSKASANNIMIGAYITMKTLGYSIGDVVTYINNGSGSPTLPAIPTTTRGDLLTVNSSGIMTRLAIGTSGKILQSNGTDPGWVSTPTTPVAVYSATITPTTNTTLGLGAISSVDATNDIITITAHGLVTGEQIISLAGWPAGTTNTRAYYINALTANTLALYTTRANAVADTSRVNITATTTGGTWKKLVRTNEFTSGMASSGALGLTTGTANIGFNFNITTSLTNGMAQLQYTGLGSVGSYSAKSMVPLPTLPISGSVIAYPNANMIIASAGAPGDIPTDIATQATTPFTVNFIVYGS